ncbi:hypothetical protein ABPG77_004455 [Micractinium sp. CCAP 211/92]
MYTARRTYGTWTAPPSCAWLPPSHVHLPGVLEAVQQLTGLTSLALFSSGHEKDLENQADLDKGAAVAALPFSLASMAHNLSELHLSIDCLRPVTCPPLGELFALTSLAVGTFVADITAELAAWTALAACTQQSMLRLENDVSRAYDVLADYDDCITGMAQPGRCPVLVSAVLDLSPPSLSKEEGEGLVLDAAAVAVLASLCDLRLLFALDRPATVRSLWALACALPSLLLVFTDDHVMDSTHLVLPHGWDGGINEDVWSDMHRQLAEQVACMRRNAPELCQFADSLLAQPAA